MTVAFESCTLADIATIYSGFAFRSQDLSSHGIPVIKIANIQDKQVRRECTDYLPEALYASRLDRYKLQQGDILIAMTGAGSVGKVGRMRKTDRLYLVNQRVAIVRVNPGIADPDYVFHVLSQDMYETKLYNIGLGAGQPNISPKDIGSPSWRRTRAHLA